VKEVRPPEQTFPGATGYLESGQAEKGVQAVAGGSRGGGEKKDKNPVQGLGVKQGERKSRCPKKEPSRQKKKISARRKAPHKTRRRRPF